MQLRFSPFSPFARKIRIAASCLGLDVETVPADTNNPNDSLRAENPLGKLPVLLADGEAIYDSRVILEWMDERAGGGRLAPRSGPARYAVLTRAALADGVADAAILQIYEERFRAPERREPRWLDHQSGKIARALAAFEDALDAAGHAKLADVAPGAVPDLGQIGLACALGYLDLRFEGEWRAGHPGLVAWLDRFAAAVPAFGATAPPAG